MSTDTRAFAGRVAVVIGASKGIGGAIAEHLASEGASVVVNYSSSREAADRVVAGITAQGGRAIAVQADVSKADDVRRLFADTLAAFGRLDVLVNNAGVYEFAPLDAVTEAHFHRLFGLNVLGLLLATQEAAKHFGPDGGAVVNVSSVVSTLAPPGGAVYSATKAAVDAATRSLAKEFGSRKIRINCVNPGLVETEGTIGMGITASESRRQAEAQTPLGRIGVPADIAPAVAFLASPAAGWITGETLYISGGLR